jgi:hypothetical protein
MYHGCPMLQQKKEATGIQYNTIQYLQYCQHLNYNTEIMMINQWFIQKGFWKEAFVA